MFADEVHKVFCNLGSAPQVGAASDFLVIASSAAGSAKRIVLPNVPERNAFAAVGLIRCIAEAIETADVSSFEQVPFRPGADGAIIVPGLSAIEMGLAHSVMQRMSASQWLEFSVRKEQQKGLLVIKGEDYMRVFEVVGEKDVMLVTPFAVDYDWATPQTPAKVLFDPAEAYAGFARAEAARNMPPGSSDEEVFAMMSRDADAAVLLMVGRVFPSSRTRAIATRHGVGLARFVVQLGRDPDLDRTRIRGGMPPWDGGDPAATVH